MFAPLRHWADRVLDKPEKFTVGIIDALWAQRYAIAVDDLNPVYFDKDHARRLGYKDIVAPPNYIATLRGDQRAGPADGELLADGMAPSARPPLPELLGMGGGQALHFHAPVYCGEFIIGERAVVGVTQKEGRTGPLVIIEEKLNYATSDGEAKLTLHNTLLCKWLEKP